VALAHFGRQLAVVHLGVNFPRDEILVGEGAGLGLPLAGAFG
jgi:hypothetical protein